MTMPKGWKENQEQKKLEEARRMEIAKHGAKKAAEIEEHEKQKWIEIERNLKQMKKEGKWLDYYDFQKLKEAEIRRKLNNYSPEPVYVPIRSSSKSSSNKRIISERGKDNLFLALFFTFLLSSIPAIAIGGHYMNWPAVIYGLIVLTVPWILIVKYGSSVNGGHGHGYYYATSRIGSSFRMWAVDKATRKRG